MVSYTTICDCNTDTHLCRTTTSMCCGEERTSCITIHLTNSTLLHICTLLVQTYISTCNYETPQQLHWREFDKTFWAGGTITGALAPVNNIRWSQKTTLHLANPHCPLPGQCFYYEAEIEQLLHGLSMLPTTVESCPPAHEVRETQCNLMGLTYLLVVYHIKLCNMCRQHYKTGLTLSHSNNTQSKEVYTTQVQVSMFTVPVQQVCPERAQNTENKQ